MKSRHLSDQELIDLQFEIAEPDAADMAQKHLQGCKACKLRAETLRATIRQIDPAGEKTVAPEYLIARTLQKTRNDPPARPAAGPSPAVSQAPAANLVDFPLRKNSIDLRRLFLVAAAAAIILAVLFIPKYFGGESPSLATLEGIALKEKIRTASSPEPVTKAGRTAPLELASVAPEKALQARDHADVLLEEAAPAPKTVAPPQFSDAEKQRKLIAQSGGASSPAYRKLEPRQTAAPARSAVALAKPDAASSPMPASAMPRKPAASEPTPLLATTAAPETPPLVATTMAASPGAGAVSADAPAVQFTARTVAFALPTTSGTWILPENVNVRASSAADRMKLAVNNRGVLPVVFELRAARGTNVLQSIAIDAGAETNLFEKVAPR